MPDLEVEISNRCEALASPEAATRDLLQALASTGRFPIPGGELSVAFVDDGEIARIHADFMDDPTPTDVITFPGDPDMDFAGEIVVSVDHARDRATEFAQPFSHELALYIVHGWLHLAGLRDKTDDERTAMRAAEREVLGLLAGSGLLDSFSLCG